MLRFVKALHVATYCSMASLTASVPTLAGDGEKCDCTIYLDRNAVSGIVIDNNGGWLDPFRAIGPHVNDREFEIRSRGRSPTLREQKEMVDCSTGDIRCVEIRRLNMILAFKSGRAGDEYTINNVQFRILAVGRQPHEPQVSLYWIAVVSSRALAVQNFVYSDRLGVVSINMGYSQQPDATGLYLSAGPGLLSLSSFPRGK